MLPNNLRDKPSKLHGVEMDVWRGHEEVDRDILTDSLVWSYSTFIQVSWTLRNLLLLCLLVAFSFSFSQWLLRAQCSSLCECMLSFVRLCSPLGCSLPGSSVCGTFQARILQWVAISFSRRSSQHRDQTHVSCVSCIAGGFFAHWTISSLCSMN